MSKGKKVLVINDSYLRAFYLNVDVYLDIINKWLSTKFKPVTLSEFIKIDSGYAFKSTDYIKQGIPVIRISDFNNEKIDLTSVKFYKESESLKKYELNEGDIIIAMTGATIGKLAIVQEDLGKLYLNQRVGRFNIIDKKIFENEYIYWIARGIEEKVKKLAWGGAQPNVSGKHIEAMTFPIPPKKIQESIIRFLNDIKSLQLNNNIYFNADCEKEIKKLQRKQTLAVEMINKSKAEKEILNNLRRSILQDYLNNSSSSKKLDELCNFEKGSSPIQKTKPGLYPLITTGGEQKSSDTFQFDTKAVCIPLVSSTGHGSKSLNYIHYQEGKFALGSILVALTAKDPNIINMKVLHHYLFLNKDDLVVSLMKGMANVTVPIGEIKKICIPIPDINKQNDFDAIMKKFDKIGENIDNNGKNAELLTKAILRVTF